MPSCSSAVVVPRDTSPLNSSTVLPASAIPSIVGVASFVSDVVVIIDGLPGAVASLYYKVLMHLRCFLPHLSL